MKLFTIEIMKTLIVSSSLNSDSKSHRLCRIVETEMIVKNKDQEIKFIDLREFEIQHVSQPDSKDAKKLRELCEWADNYVFGIAIYNYNVNDSFSSFVCNYLPKKKFHLYGLVLAAGGDRSFLVTSAANQMLMTHNNMLAFPRFLYASGGDWADTEVLKKPQHERMETFAKEFFDLGKKLLKK